MKHPFQLLVSDKAGKYLFASAKNHLFVFTAEDGKLVGSWIDDVDISVPLKKQQQEKIKALEAEAAATAATAESGESPAKKAKTNDKKVKIPKIPVPGPGAPPIYNYIRTLALSQKEGYLIGTTDSDKAAIIFKLDFSNPENCLSLIKRQVFPKRPCAVSTTFDDSMLIVADKFGDVYSIPINSEPPVDEKALVPILGHVSMLSDVLVAEHNEKQYILTGDRDEHIRITNYPSTYVIKDWMFGHKEFVSSLHIPSFDSNLLISGGGDDYLAVWKWFESKLVAKVELREFILPFLTSSHLPPERFLLEDSIKEVSITYITTYVNPKDSSKLLIVLCENTKCVLTFDIKENEEGYSFSHKQTFETEYPMTAMSLANNLVYASLDTESEDQLLKIIQINDNNELVDVSKDNAGLITEISSLNNCEVESRKDFYPLYYINSLRKRSEH